MQRYSSTNKQIDQLMVDVGKTQATQQQRVREYDQMHALVVEERRDIGIHVAAGRVRMAELEQARLVRVIYAPEEGHVGKAEPLSLIF